MPFRMNVPSLQPSPSGEGAAPWWRGLSPRHGLILGIAWMGWVFDLMDVFLLVLYKDTAMKDLLGPAATREAVSLYGGIALGVTLVGWSVGGLVFGIIADRWGRTRTMALTILMYSLFTGLSGFSQTWWHLILLRFLAALGIGGEWGTGASLIAEVFPRRSRAVAAGILQSASGIGFFAATFIFGAVNAMIPRPEDAWRCAFFAGAAPAFLALVVRLALRESEAWVAARERARTSARERLGSLAALFQDPVLRRRTLVATGMALLGLFAYWGTNFWAKEALVDLLKRTGTPAAEIPGRVLAGMLVMNAGSLLGFLVYIPITERIGRRWAFALFHVGSLVSMPVAFLASDSDASWKVLFSIASAFTCGIFSGYTIYFPELYPTRLRATGASFCYNVGRIAAAPGPILMGWLQGAVGSIGVSGAIMGGVYALALVFIPFLPETRGVRLDAEAPDAEDRGPSPT
jgi:MFS family permease